MWPKPAGLSRGATSSAWCGRAQPIPPDGAAAVGRRAHWARRCARFACFFVCSSVPRCTMSGRTGRTRSFSCALSGRPDPPVALALPYPHLYPSSRCPPTKAEWCPVASCAPVRYPKPHRVQIRMRLRAATSGSCSAPPRSSRLWTSRAPSAGCQRRAPRAAAGSWR